MTGIYTGLRLGDCCRLSWESVDLERRIIQVIPEKTKKHAHGRPVTIPIHPSLMSELVKMRNEGDHSALLLQLETPTHRKPIVTGYVNPTVAELYLNRKWMVSDGLRRLFKAANISMSMRLEGRSRKSVIASFHSLRHTFVSISANAGVPLPVVQSIVGHCSTAMTRHYYHENEDVLRQAVEAIPSFGIAWGRGNESDVVRKGSFASFASHPTSTASRNAAMGVPARLKRLERYRAQGLVTLEEYVATRAKILSEL